MIIDLFRANLPEKGRTVAFIDIGTNSVRLLLVRVNPDLSYKVISHRKESVRLGEGEFPSMELQPEAMHRAVLVCRRFVEMARANDAEEILAVATSATRDALNRDDFLRQLRQQAGLEVHVISGKEEARLIYLGISSALHLEDQQALFLDIGGGSTELIVGRQQEYQYLDTLQLGHIRLSMTFFPDEENTISLDRYQQVQDQVRDVAVRALQEISGFEINCAFGSSGTIENLGEIAARLFLDRKRQPEDVLTLEQLSNVREMLCNLPLAERRKVPGIDQDRADIIIGGAAILETILQELEINEIQISERSLRDGLLLDYLSRLGRKHPEAGASFRETSVLRLGRSLHFNEEHARRVADLSLQLFDSSREIGLHDYGSWEQDILYYSALLHDIGIALSYSGHHAHSYYFIHNADLLGFDQTEIDLMAATAFFHRKRVPRNKYEPYSQLRKGEKKRVLQLSVLLSIAESLDRSHLGLVEKTWFSLPTKKRAVLHLKASEHCPLELWGVAYQKDAFTKAFNRKLSTEMEGVEHPTPLKSSPN